MEFPPFDPAPTLQLVDARLRATTDLHRRAALDNFLAHLRAEWAGDLDAIMATLSASPRFRFFTPGDPGGDGPSGRDAVARWYSSMFAHGYHKHVAVFERLVVDDDVIITEGWMHTPYRGEVLGRLGLDVDPHGWYRYSARVVAVLPQVVEQGRVLMRGEEVYIVPDLPTADTVSPLDPSELPDW
ncbi:MAG: nuclear transport factor 2 family protein [Acidimicrobiales bacterium]|nr:nuclear transport factor 2 family protein [Acidimicrobiales bacterium]